MDRKVLQDHSPQRYILFLHNIKDKSRGHRATEDNDKIIMENKYLLEKIVHSKTRKMKTSFRS